MRSISQRYKQANKIGFYTSVETGLKIDLYLGIQIHFSSSISIIYTAAYMHDLMNVCQAGLFITISFR